MQKSLFSDYNYEGTFKYFVEKGDYKIIIYAVDSKGVYSSPVSIKIHQEVSKYDVNKDNNVDLKDMMIILSSLTNCNQGKMSTYYLSDALYLIQYLMKYY